MGKLKEITVEAGSEIRKIPAETLEFINGLAIVKVDIKDWRRHDGIITYKGVVNEQGNTVLPLRAYYLGIDIYPDNNLIVKIRKGNDDQTVTWTDTIHYKCSEFSTSIVNKKISSGYIRVNDNVIKTAVHDEDKGKYIVLYDVLKAEIISEQFTIIGNFEIQPTGEKLAKAITTLKCDDGTDNEYDMICYINEAGEIRTPIFNSYNNKIFLVEPKSAYQDSIEIIRKEMQKDIKEKEKAKQKALEYFWKLKI